MGRVERALWRATRDGLDDKASKSLEMYGQDSAHAKDDYRDLAKHCESKKDRLGHAADRLRGGRR